MKNDYLDFMSQSGVMNLGHGNTAVVAAIKGQVDKLIFSSHLSFPNIPAIELAEKLIEITPGNFPKNT